MARVRRRLLAAVVAPVAFVALGASLLVHAHLRAFDTSSRQNDAAELAQGVLDPVDGDVRGRKQAIEAAQAYGFDVELSRSTTLFSATRTDEGRTKLAVPLADGHALVRFETARVSPGTTVYLGLALIAIAIAGMLGWRTGGAFSDDVGLAEQELEATGVADVLRGGRILGDARFQSVAALMNATDKLGGVFREFASAQQRAIDARTSTERMRGLFLASMSHDLKAPLNAILGFAGLVSRGNADRRAARERRDHRAARARAPLPHRHHPRRGAGRGRRADRLARADARRRRRDARGARRPRAHGGHERRRSSARSSRACRKRWPIRRG